MASITVAPPATDHTLDTTYTAPRMGRGPAAEGRRAALRSFHADVMTLDGDVEADIARVAAGTAPVEFKQAYMATLRSLSTLFTGEAN